MINISNTIKQACNGDKLTYREYVVLKGTTTQIDVSTEMYATAYKDTHFIGTFNMKYIKFTTANDVQYRNKELTLFKEINGEAFKVGNFIVTEIKDDDSNEEVSVTAYDYGLKFAQPYTTTLDYESGNVTLKNVLDEICENVGVELVNQTIINENFIVDSNQFVNGEMYGDVVSAVAYLSGDFATITSDDKLKLIFNTATDEIIEDYVDLEDKRDTRPITSLSIGTSQVQGQNAVIKDETLIEQYGEHWLEINDVPFAYTLEKREQLKQAIFDKVKGFGYSSFKSEYAFKPYMELGDLVQFRNKEGNLVSSIILKITSKYDNIILEAPSVTDATIKYENPKTAYDVAKRAEIIANQNTAEITYITTQTNEITNDLNNNYYTIEQTNQIVQNAETGLTNTFASTGGNNLFRETAPYTINYDNTIPYWGGNIGQIKETNSASGYALLIKNGVVRQTIELKNGVYSLGFKYKQLIPNSVCVVSYNGRVITLGNETDLTQISTTGEITTGLITIEISCDTENGYEIAELMLNIGETLATWSQNANESHSDTVNISDGITVSSSSSNTDAKMDDDGFRVLNKGTQNTVLKATDDGIEATEVKANKGNIAGLIIQEISDEIWITGEI